MITDFISITNLQKSLKTVFASKQKPFQLVLSNNQLAGMVVSKEATKLMADSGLIDQLREELWEMADSDTKNIHAKIIAGAAGEITFDEFKKKHAL